MDFNPNLLVHAAPAMVILALIELLLLKHEGPKKETRKNAITSLVIGIGFLCIALPLKAVPFMINTWVYQFRFFELKQTAVLVILLAILVDDFTVYWSHRLSHNIRYFWASHLVHHSSETYNLLAGGRQSWVGMYTGSFLFACWIPLVGITPELMLWAKSINTIYQFFVHTEHIRKLPRWIEFIFNTPSHHRVHHSREARNLDMNNGGILIIWDRIFGTFVPEEKETEYGLCKEIKDPNPVNINFNEFRDIFNDLKKSPKLYHKFMYIFGPPGWSHDGSTKTAKQLRKELAASVITDAASVGTPRSESQINVMPNASFPVVQTQQAEMRRLVPGPAEAGRAPRTAFSGIRV